MIARVTKQLREVETLYRKIFDFEPTTAVETEMKELLMTLVKSRRSELQRQLFKSRIRLKGWPLLGVNT